MEREHRTGDHLLTWQPEFSVHIEAIDRQHQLLVNFIRQLQEAMEEGRGRAFQGTLIQNLVTYTQFHFRFEEDLMREHNYEGLEKHAAQHAALTKQVEDLERRVHAGGYVSNASLILFLRHWLTDHILEHDKKYAGVIKPTPATNH